MTQVDHWVFYANCWKSHRPSVGQPNWKDGAHREKSSESHAKQEESKIKSRKKF